MSEQSNPTPWVDVGDGFYVYDLGTLTLTANNSVLLHSYYFFTLGDFDFKNVWLAEIVNDLLLFRKVGRSEIEGFIPAVRKQDGTSLYVRPILVAKNASNLLVVPVFRQMGAIGELSFHVLENPQNEQTFSAEGRLIRAVSSRLYVLSQVGSFVRNPTPVLQPQSGTDDETAFNKLLSYLKASSDTYKLVDGILETPGNAGVTVGTGNGKAVVILL